MKILGILAFEGCTVNFKLILLCLTVQSKINLDVIQNYLPNLSVIQLH